MLSIVDVANSDWPIGIGNPFTIGATALIEDQALKLWLTRPSTNANVALNYTVTGPEPRSVVLAQYETPSVVRLYFDQPLVGGQWTISTSTNIHSDDSDNLSLSATTVIDIAESLPLAEPIDQIGTVAGFLPKKIRNKRGTAELIAAFQAGDDLVNAQARFAAEQHNLSTATGKYLTTRAFDRGIEKPEKLGMSDEAFSKLAISLVNQRLTQPSLLRVLESMYGTDSVHAFVNSKTGPFRVFDKGTIGFLVDGSVPLVYVLDISRFANPMEVSAKALAADINLFFADSRLFAEDHEGQVRVFSSTMGLQSKIAVTGGTLQPYLQFDTSIGDLATADVNWEVTNPRPGIVRLQPDSWPYEFTKVRIGDYITIVGENFPLELRNSWRVVNTNYSYSGADLVQWLEIESDYIAGT
jgi:hypothetical protein